MIDRARILQDAQYVAEAYDGQTAGAVAQALIQFIQEPGLWVPDGYRLVKMPELLGKGVPGRP